ncbi:glutamyl-tRNA reductase [Albibacterium bauzanense]|uniref:glutamyl-tRNA reductase n=1 Tax=Albibacterium bauzanense TaxID=653929 RepID=UPI0010515017|nr:glutamyl-tRNA reductase [Albibacterium bauzanense]
MKNLKVIAFTHKNVDLKDLGNLVICDEELESRLLQLKAIFNTSEIFYIGTCNRVEFVFYGEQDLNDEFKNKFIDSLGLVASESQRLSILNQVNTYDGREAINHLFRISCSLESLVVGEKEILSQVRKAYERCRCAGFTGDFMRMLMSSLVKTAKEVYTQTDISRKPVSVVSLAYRSLRDSGLGTSPRFLIIGAGETNQNIAKYIQKHKDSNFVVFNRTLEKAESLAKELNGKAYPLSELENYKGGFDVLITCTGSTSPLIDNDLYQKLLNGDKSKKTIVDLAIPNDTAEEVIKNNSINYIEVSSLQAIANRNIQDRYEELVHAERIIEENIEEFIPLLKQRKVEIAMREVPQKVKEIKSFALNTVFAQEVSSMDEDSRAVLEKVMNYMEKKYISVPMVMAKEILVKNSGLQ